MTRKNDEPNKRPAHSPRSDERDRTAAVDQTVPSESAVGDAATVASRSGSPALDQTVPSESAVGDAATVASRSGSPALDQTVPSESAVGDAATVASRSGGPALDQTVPSESAVGDAATVASGSGSPALDRTVPSDSVVGRARTAASETGSPPSARSATRPAESGYRAGERFGPFEVLEPLGEGGMGVVFAAHDPDLERKVAIKVLRSTSAAGGAQLRLLREAQAMAQLSHPNVITVHQVGTRDDQVFVVMEYVDSGTLRDWVGVQPRGWREVLETYRSAGLGLAAAHRAGLVHRDFKPDNVLLRSDGQVLVTDFGLVATVGSEVAESTVPSAPGSAPATSSSSKLALQLTRTGEVMGTPLYMAPEQHKGERADARADQFAFCVALFEALYGVRPFGGKTYAEVAANVLNGAPCPVPEGSKVPGWVHEVVLRGLRTDPAQRYPDMEALLDALGRDPAVVRRRRWLAATMVAAVLAIGGLTVALWAGLDAGERCRSAGDGISAVWNDQQRSALRRAWAGARDQLEPILAALDRYGHGWVRERVAACEATYVKGEQSERLLDRRMFCLDRRLGEMVALVERMADKGASLVQSAAQAVAGLPRFDECRDREALAEVMAPPPQLEAAVKEVSQQLDRVEAHRALGELEAALSLGRTALERAKQLDYSPLLARAHFLVGFVASRSGQHAQAETHYRAAISRAAQAKAHYIEAKTWLSLIYLVGHTTDRPDPALALATAAEAAVARAAGDAALRGQLEGNLGLILLSKGDYQRARARLEQSLRTFEQLGGPDDLDTAIARNNLAIVLERLGEHRAAYASLQQVLAVRQQTLGAEHPSVATALNDLGNSAHSLGDLAKAREHLERALAIREAVLGPAHPRTAHTLTNLAIVLGDLGKHALAVKHAERAVAIAEAAFDENHPELAGPLNTLGEQLRALGQRQRAWEAYARGLAIIEYAKGRDHISVAPMVENLARLLLDLGHTDRAIAFADRAIAVRQRVQGPGHPLLLNALALRGWFNLAAKRPKAAVADFDRQRTQALEAFGEAHLEVAQASYNLAVAHERAGALDTAERWYQAALAIFETVAADSRFVTNAWRGLGDIASARHDVTTAQQHYERAVTQAKRIGDPSLGDLLRLLSATEAKRGRGKKGR